MSSAIWKKIQNHVGASVDGVPGPQTAKKVAEALGIEEIGMITGAGKNIDRIVIHCTATKEGVHFTASDIDRWHRDRGWSEIGYHFVINLDGTIEKGRNEAKIGSHVRGHNTGSIGIVYVGGLDGNGRPKDTRTPSQKSAMKGLVEQLLEAYPGADVLGHRDHPGVAKECPCFSVRDWWSEVS